MNYIRIYEQIIARAKLEVRNKTEGYYEKHHIVPRSLGGSNCKGNIAMLTAREHFICHWLLTKMYKEDETARVKMVRAFFMMKAAHSKHKRYVNSRAFVVLREIAYGPNGIMKGEGGSFYGKKLSIDHRNKLSERMTMSNPMAGKRPWNYGLTKDTSEKVRAYGEKNKGLVPVVTDESRRRQSEAAKRNGLGKVKTDEHRESIRKAMQGKTIPDDVKEKIRLAKQGIKKELISCPHCSKSGGIPAMQRWHFDNCKSRV